MSSIVQVGMPVYNAVHRVGMAIEAILGQTYRDFELIISDNASSDGSYEICKRFAAGDNRIKLSRNPCNIGLAANFNRTFELSTAPLFMWASSNDRFAPTMLARCVVELQARPELVLCFGGTRFFEKDPADSVDYPENLDLQSESPSERFLAVVSRLRINNAIHGVIRSEALRKTSLVRNYLSSDMVLMAELALHGKFRQLDEVLFYRRMDQNSSTSHMESKKLIAYWGLKSSERTQLTTWHMNLGYLAAALRAPLSARERARVLRMVLKCFYWGAGEMSRELIFLARGRPA